MKNINKPAFFALVIYPLLLLLLLIHYIWNFPITWLEITCLLLGYYGANIAVGIGLHRLWSHHAYKTNKYIELILSIISAGTLQGPALSWASNHADHHTYTDTEKDPHTPLKYKNKIIGFYWSHLGWMLRGEGSYRSITRLTMAKHGRNKVLRWQFKYYWQIALIMNTIVPALIGLLFGQKLIYAYSGYLFIGVGRALQQQATFCVNSLCHFIGKKEYTKSTAGDIWWMAIFLLGENWHNFHHAFPSDYRNGAKWYQADVHKWIIYAMSKIGLAYDLKRTAKVRVEAKVTQTLEQYIHYKHEQLKSMQIKVQELVESLQTKFTEIENSRIALQGRLLNSYSNTQQNLYTLKAQLGEYLKNLETTPVRLLSSASKELHNTENSSQKLYSELEKVKNNRIEI